MYGIRFEVSFAMAESGSSKTLFHPHNSLLDSLSLKIPTKNVVYQMPIYNNWSTLFEGSP